MCTNNYSISDQAIAKIKWCSFLALQSTIFQVSGDQRGFFLPHRSYKKLIRRRDSEHEVSSFFFSSFFVFYTQ